MEQAAQEASQTSNQKTKPVKEEPEFSSRFYKAGREERLPAH
jgi:hypothetical protein